MSLLFAQKIENATPEGGWESIREFANSECTKLNESELIDMKIEELKEKLDLIR
jgi:hypothetical protein